MCVAQSWFHLFTPIYLSHFHRLKLKINHRAKCSTKPYDKENKTKYRLTGSKNRLPWKIRPGAYYSISLQLGPGDGHFSPRCTPFLSFSNCIALDIWSSSSLRLSIRVNLRSLSLVVKERSPTVLGCENQTFVVGCLAPLSLYYHLYHLACLTIWIIRVYILCISSAAG